MGLAKSMSQKVKPRFDIVASYCKVNARAAKLVIDTHGIYTQTTVALLYMHRGLMILQLAMMV